MTRAYSTTTLAARWACSPQTVRDLIDRGALDAIRLGRVYRIPAESVERYETCQRSGSGGSAAAGPAGGGRAASGDASASVPVIVMAQPRKRRTSTAAKPVPTSCASSTS